MARRLHEQPPARSCVMASAQRSFETIYRAHVADVYRYALAATGNTSDAEDVTQTTFMNAYRSYAGGQRPVKPQNWLLTIAHNVCRQRSRVSSRRPYEVPFVDDVAEALTPDDDTPSAADIRRALARLPYMQRATLIMRELEGRTHAEIAEILGLTAPATEMLAFRARRALREHLAGSLTCTQAEAALDRQQDGSLPEEDAGLLRAHLRECPDCERLARRIRAQRAAWGAMAVVPVPSTLRSFGGGATAAGAGVGASGVAVKAAALTVAAATAGGGVYVARHTVTARPPHTPPASTQSATTARSTVQAGKPPRRTPAPIAAVTPAARVTTQAPSAEPPQARAPVTHTNNGVRRRAHGAPSQRKAPVKHGRQHESTPPPTRLVGVRARKPPHEEHR